MRSTPSLAGLVAAAALALAAGTAEAKPTAQVDDPLTNGHELFVSGTATFPAITEPQSVVTGASTRAAGQVGGSAAGEAAGLGLQDGRIVPLPDGSGLRFSWHLSSLPAQVPPEGVRYTWSFKVGQRIYQLQAKRTNLVSLSTAEDPVGHLGQAQKQSDFFQLRGACVPAYLGVSVETPAGTQQVNGCYHLAFLQGRFDEASKTVSIDVPFRTQDAIGRVVAPDLVPGALLTDNGGVNSAGMVIAASFQAVVSNTVVSRYINGVRPFYAGPAVEVAVGPAGGSGSGLTYTTAALEPNGRFKATLPAGAPAEPRALFVRACHGVDCAFVERPFG